MRIVRRRVGIGDDVEGRSAGVTVGASVVGRLRAEEEVAAEGGAGEEAGD